MKLKREKEKKRESEQAQSTSQLQDNQKSGRKRKYSNFATEINESDQRTDRAVEGRLKQNENAKGDDQQDRGFSRPHVIARLKLPAKTIEEFYGRSPTS